MPVPVEQLIIKIAGDSKEFTKAIGNVKKANKDAEASFKSFKKVAGVSFLAAGAAATAFAAKATQAFTDFETGLVGVKKTTNLSGKELEALKKNVIEMSQEIPVGTQKLLDIGIAAGQLGIKGVDNLTSFIKTVALLGATTDVEGGDAALAIAQIFNLTGESIKEVDKFGSSIVALGNNFETSESKILTVANEVAKATVNYRLSSTDVLGLSTAMSSLGIEAEAGSTVVGQAFMAIESAIAEQGGPAFEKLIELTGMTGDELTNTFYTDANKVFKSFIVGLGDAGSSGKVMADELETLHLSGIRVNKILPTLANRSNVVSEALDMSGKAAEENSALYDEAAQAFSTSASKIQIAQNRTNNALVETGEETAPKVAKAMDRISKAENIALKAYIKYGETVADIIGAVFDKDTRAKLAASSREREQTNFLKAELKKRGISYEDYIKQTEDRKIKSDAKIIKQEKSTGKEIVKQEGKTQKELKKDREDAAKKRIAQLQKEKNDALKVKDAELRERQDAIVDEYEAEYWELEQAKQKEIDESLRADQEMFDNIAETTDDIIYEYKEREKEAAEAKQREIDDSIAADQEMFDQLQLRTDDIVDEYKRREDEETAELKRGQLDRYQLLKEETALIVKQMKSRGEKVTDAKIAALLLQKRNEDKSVSDTDLLYIKYHDKRIEDEEVYGKIYEGLTKAQNDARYNAVKGAAGELSQLINSENDHLKEIGKAATIVQIGISSAESAMKAYAGLAWIPVVGPGLGAAAALAIGFYGLEQINKVRNMKEGGIAGFGSVVPGVGRGDKVPTMLEPGELVVPYEITKDLLRGMAEGGRVAPGAKENKKMYQTFADIFNPVGLFKSLVFEYLGIKKKTEDSSKEASGFGAEYFGGMIGKVVSDAEGAIEELVDLYLNQLPGGEYLAAAVKLTGVGKEKLKEIIADVAGEGPLYDFLDALDPGLAVDILGGVTNAGGDIGEFVKDIASDAAGAVDKVKEFFDSFSFQNGGIVGMTSPGEMRISQDALKAIASGMKMSNNSAMPMRSISRSSSTKIEKQIVGIELSMNQNLAEFVTVKQREGKNLGTMTSPW